jgi:hypothetical protein
MAMVPRRSAAMARRVTTYSLAADVVAALLVGILISSVVGWIVFVVGLVVTGFVYFNVRQVMRTRGMR